MPTELASGFYGLAMAAARALRGIYKLKAIVMLARAYGCCTITCCSYL
ncbi:MAG: hypothetical protein ACP5HK_04275 [Acidilobus sp.]